MVKVLSLSEMKKIRENLRNDGKKVAFTNGCFDILHIGHVRYLAEAKSKGDILILGLNSDSSVRGLKGEKRPLVPESERAEMLAALEVVDHIVIFNESTPENLISELKPDVHVKGGDYKLEDLPEAKIVQSYGGDVALVSLVDNHSTSNLVKKIAELYGNNN